MSDSKVYSPSSEFVARAQVQGMAAYREIQERAASDPAKFWAELASRS